MEFKNEQGGVYRRVASSLSSFQACLYLLPHVQIHGVFSNIFVSYIYVYIPKYIDTYYETASSNNVRNSTQSFSDIPV